MEAVCRWSTLILALVLTAAAVTDGNLAYAAFHAAAALVAAASVWWRKGRWSPLFLLAFGLIDTYQAAASALGWFPSSLFHYSSVDDAVHLWLGLFLIVSGSAVLILRRNH